jgi:hypothetical protein
MNTFTDQELIMLHRGIKQVDISQACLSAHDKIAAELKARGIKVDSKVRPKAKYQKKSVYDYHYTRGTETLAIVHR